MSFPLSLPGSFSSGYSINWEALEDILRAWVMAGTGLATGRVWWADQKIPQGQTDFAVIRIGNMTTLGAFDSHTDYTDLTADAGEEIELRTRGDRELSVNVQIFSSSMVGNTCARALAVRLQAVLGLPSIRGPMQDVGITPFDSGEIQNLSGLIGAEHTGRASLDCRFYVCEAVSDRTGYIETVESTSYMGPPDSGTAEEIDI